MTGTLIALESTNSELLEKTARYLVLQLRAEGYDAELCIFPRAHHNASYFIKEYEAGNYSSLSPYVASMFYGLDRFEAALSIKKMLQKDTVVVCAGYIGSSLAKLGTQIPEKNSRRNFYIWADSLETGTFASPRAHASFVISKELPTLKELCELFPKDYTYISNPANIRDAIETILPSNHTHAAKKETKHTTSWSYAVKNMALDLESKSGYFIPNTVSENAKTLYLDGLKELDEAREIVLKKLPADLHDEARDYLTPVGKKVAISKKVAPPKSDKTSAFSSLLFQHINDTYGQTERKPRIINATSRNELDLLKTILLQETELSLQEIDNQLQQMPIDIKYRLLEAYIAEVRTNKQSNSALQSLHLEISLTACYKDIVDIARSIGCTYSMATPTPRQGFDIPAKYIKAADEIENCYDLSLSLYAQLEALNSPEAASLVTLKGHYTKCILQLNGEHISALVSLKANNKTRESIKSITEQILELLSQNYPVLTS